LRDKEDRNKDHRERHKNEAQHNKPKQKNCPDLLPSQCQTPPKIQKDKKTQRITLKTLGQKTSRASTSDGKIDLNRFARPN